MIKDSREEEIDKLSAEILLFCQKSPAFQGGIVASVLLAQLAGVSRSPAGMLSVQPD